jgi:rare lipoprotein A
MYAPATPALSAALLQPAGIVASEASPPIDTALRVRYADMNVLQGDATTITGRLLGDLRLAQARGELVTLQVRTRHGWRRIADTRTGDHGGYRLHYRPRRLGRELVRLDFRGDAEVRGSHRRLGRLGVYHLAEASWYGGGGSLACGGSLTSSTLGVANKTLPCGTRVTLRYDGRTVRVPVVDRGPYVAGREFDLTEATKRALGFEGVGEVWAT